MLVRGWMQRMRLLEWMRLQMWQLEQMRDVGVGRSLCPTTGLLMGLAEFRCGFAHVCFPSPCRPPELLKQAYHPSPFSGGSSSEFSDASDGDNEEELNGVSDFESVAAETVPARLCMCARVIPICDSQSSPQPFGGRKQQPLLPGSGYAELVAEYPL